MVDQQREMEDAGWRGKVGWIQPPRGTVDPFQFLQIAPPGLRVIPNLMHLAEEPEKSIDLPWGERLTTGDAPSIVAQVERASAILKEAGAEIITQSGSPLSFLAGGLSGGRAVQSRVEQSVGLPFVMMGLAMLNAANEFGYQRAAVAATPYRHEWLADYKSFLEDGGVEVLTIENWVQQGIFATQEDVDRAMHPQHSKVTHGMTYQAAAKVMQKSPGADCLFILGGAVVAIDAIESLEQDFGVPVIAAASAQFWEIFKRLGIGTAIRGCGSLLASLGRP